MRSVEKDLKDIPPCLTKKKVLDSLEIIATTANKDLIKDAVFKGVFMEKGEKQHQVRTYLHKYYLKKCAYCEMFEAEPEIEHYRPKKAVTGSPEHNGYYWLCYEWSNLIPSCRYCNTEGGKGSDFPIMGKRVDKPTFKDKKLNVEKNIAKNAPLIDEKPCLLHPEIDTQFETFLEFKIDDKKEGIKIVGIDGLKRGEETIRICNLNYENKRINRLHDVYKPFKKGINGVFGGDLESAKIFKGLESIFKQEEKEALDPHSTHTLLRKFILKDDVTFSQHFAPYLDNEKQRTLVVEAFKRYKNGTLHKLF